MHRNQTLSDLERKLLIKTFPSNINHKSTVNETLNYTILVSNHEQADILSNDTKKNKTNPSDELKCVNKRQRLTNLSKDEKVIRRKLKNRVAAQNARDRKKTKMENLEKEIMLLKEQNKILKAENNLLIEKSKILINENNLLTTYKQAIEASQNSLKQREFENSKLDNERLCFEVARLAASVSRVSQPKKLLQTQLFQSLICLLMYVSLFNQRQKSSNLKKIQIQPLMMSNYHIRMRTSVLKILNLINILHRRNVHYIMDKDKVKKLMIVFQCLKKMLVVKRMPP